MLALEEIEADIENVRTAWRYYLKHKDVPQIWKFMYGLWHVYWIRWWNHAGKELFTEAVKALEGEESDEAVAIRSLANAFQGYFMAWLGLADQGYQLAKQSLESLQSLNYPDALAFAYDSMSINSYMLNRYSEQIEIMKKMVEIARGNENKWLEAFLLFGLCMGNLMEGDYDEVRKLAKYNLTLYEEMGDVIGSAMPLIVLGHEALARGELDHARNYYLRCLAISEKAGFYFATQTATKYLGKVDVSLGNLKEAEKYLLQSLGISKDIGFERDLIRLIFEFAHLFAAQRNHERGVELLALVLKHPAADHTRWLEGHIKDNIAESLVKFKNQLSPEVYVAAIERGKLLDLDEVVKELLGG
jgi:tetratricopeptide (TPR) repeat protein